MRYYMSNFFVPVLVIVLCQQTIPSESATGSQIVEQTCKRAAQSSATLNYDFCVTSLKAVPSSASADLLGLGIIATTLAEANATDTGKKIDGLLPRSSDPYDQARLKDCKELYLDAFSALKDAEKAFNSWSYFDANIQLSAALDGAATCEDAWKEKPGHASLLSAENYNLQQLCRIGLAISNLLVATF